MGIFVGERKNSRAAKCGLHIAWAFTKILKPRFETKYPALVSYGLAHSTGIDTSKVLAVRGGIRNNNDLVWVGRAPNVAAKLSAIREDGYYTYISKVVFDMLAEDAKYSNSDRRLMWEARTWTNGVPGVDSIYRSNWTWTP